MSSKFRRDVLKTFKTLHRTRKSVFEGDTFALNATRHKLNEDFRKNKNMTDESVIENVLKIAQEVELLLRTTVVQARKVEPGTYRARITEVTVKTDNVKYGDALEEPPIANRTPISTIRAKE
uniref:Complex III assembly factor LYRM7 n=1 Tax=Graphocephala atropunctata TaxID=36148 RepID=A0A1B6KZT5_9HEMI